MKKIYLLTMMLLFAFLTNAQVTVQGFPRKDLKENPAQKKQLRKAAADFTFDDIQYWVGTGSNEAAFVVQWNDEKNPDALVWGFRWDGDATGLDMLQAIAKADKRFYTLLYYTGPDLGTAVGGLGFDLDGEGTIGLYKDGNTTYPLYPSNGIINTTAYDFDDYTAIDANDHWFSAWLTKGYLSYWVKDSAEAEFDYSGLGASSRQLQNGSWDVWNSNPDFTSYDISSTFTAVSPYNDSVDFSKGFFMVNEDWFGHTNGSVNFFDENNVPHYNVYRAANDNASLGVTTQYGAIYGDKFYLISKQSATDGDGRLVVADAKTMKKITSFDNIGGGDGRSFLGVDEHKGYIGASNGIFLFDIDQLQVGNIIEGTDGGSLYSGQIGNMIRTSKYVYAVKQGTGIFVIDPKTDEIIKTLDGVYISIVQAKDGSVWAAMANKLVKIDETDFTTTEVTSPTVKIGNTWGAWNAGSFTASMKDNAIYWIHNYGMFGGGPNIVKFDVTTQTFNDNFAMIPGQDGQFKEIPYASALRVDPISGNLILNTTESGYGSHYQKNWIHIYDNSGALKETKTLNDYYWFPAMTVFPDNDEPVVSSAFPTEITVDKTKIIDLKSIVSDDDNLSAAIVKTIQSNSNEDAVLAEINENEELVLTPENSGKTTIVISFNSNGKVVEKTLDVTVSTLATHQVEKVELSIYPNPATDILNVKTQDKITGISVFDFSGKLIDTKINNGQINVSALPKGNYIVKIITDKAVYQEKFIKK